MTAPEDRPWLTDPRRFHPGDSVWEKVREASRTEAAFIEWLTWNAYVQKHRFDEDETRETKLYITGPEDGSRFKIGLSATPGNRVANLQVGAGVPLKLFAAVPAKLSLEKFLHETLAAHRVHGEWYDGSPRVLAVADLLLGINQACFDMECLDDGGFVPLLDDTLAWMFFRVEEAIAEIERHLRAAASVPPSLVGEPTKKGQPNERD